jgi:hypothetical protein
MTLMMNIEAPFMAVSGQKKTREWPGFEAIPITHLSPFDRSAVHLKAA